MHATSPIETDAQIDTATALFRGRVGFVDWQADAQFCDIRRGGPDWFALQADPRATLVKRGRGRSVWRVVLGSSVVFAKVFEATPGAGRIKALLGGRPAQREWLSLQEAAQRGVSVPQPLALGLACDGSDRSVLITAGISDARTLEDAWREICAVTPPVRHAVAKPLIDAVAALLAQAHLCGLAHPDAHPRNILISVRPDGGPRAWFLDLHAPRFSSRPVGPVRSAEVLAQLDHYFRRVATRGERLRFWNAYRARMNSVLQAPHDKDERFELILVDRAERRLSAVLARRRDRRLSGRNAYFGRIELENGWRGVVVLRLARRHVFPEPAVSDRDEATWRTLLAELDLLHETAPVPSSTRPVAVDFETQCLSGWSRLKAILIGSPHRRAFLDCHRRRHRDEPAPLVLGYLERRSHGFVQRTTLLRAR